jgi:hypothetical protein
MTALEDQLVVFRLALLTEDRTVAEQSALQRVAERIESEWNRMTSVNVRRLRQVGPIDLVAEMLDALPDDDKLRGRAERWAEKIETGARRRRYRSEGLLPALV